VNGNTLKAVGHCQGHCYRHYQGQHAFLTRVCDGRVAGQSWWWIEREFMKLDLEWVVSSGIVGFLCDDP